MILAKGLKQRIEKEQERLKDRSFDSESLHVFESGHADRIVFEAHARTIKAQLCGTDTLLGISRQPKPILSDEAAAVIGSINILHVQPLDPYY